MFDKLKRDLYFGRLKLLWADGIKNRQIEPFDEEFYSHMNDVIVANIPVAIDIKYLKPKMAPGKCYDRSLSMFFCFPDAYLVRGDNKDLELNYGKDNAGHGWIELDDYVYDPSLRMKFKKELYYKMYQPTNVKKCSKEEYDLVNENFYDEVRSVSREDFKPGGKKRYELATTIPLLKEIADMENDANFKRDLDEYLKSIEYDEQQVYEELNQGIRNLMSKR